MYDCEYYDYFEENPTNNYDDTKIIGGEECCSNIVVYGGNISISEDIYREINSIILEDISMPICKLNINNNKLYKSIEPYVKRYCGEKKLI